MVKKQTIAIFIKNSYILPVPTQKSKLLSVARKHCANWDNGNCLGVLLKRSGGLLSCRTSKRLAGKPCCVASGCDYFNLIVIPGVSNGH